MFQGRADKTSDSQDFVGLKGRKGIKYHSGFGFSYSVVSGVIFYNEAETEETEA